MIGFIAAISASLAIMVLVVIASLIGFVQSILPASGLVKIDEFKYRYYMASNFVPNELLGQLVRDIHDLDLSANVYSYQNGCSYGFNTSERQALEISTFNYIVLNQYFEKVYPTENVILIKDDSIINNCFIDINLKKNKKV